MLQSIFIFLIIYVVSGVMSLDTQRNTVKRNTDVGSADAKATMEVSARQSLSAVSTAKATISRHQI